MAFFSQSRGNHDLNQAGKDQEVSSQDKIVQSSQGGDPWQWGIDRKTIVDQR